MNKKLNDQQVYKIRVILSALGVSKAEVAERLGLQENYMRQQLGGFVPFSRPIREGFIALVDSELFGDSPEGRVPPVLRESP